MLASFGEVKASGAIDIAGCSPTSDDFRNLVNKAVRMLMRRGDWPGTVVPIKTCATRGCATFPRYVEQVRKINVCNTPIATHNLYWEFLPKNTFGCGSGLGAECSMTGQGRSPTQFDIWGDGRYVRVYITDVKDVNKRITLFGEDNNGQPYTETITLGAPGSYVQTQSLVRRIDRVLKDLTIGRVIMTGYYAATGSVEELATYEASETNPSLLRINLNIPGCSTNGSCPSTKMIAALVKFRFIPVIADSDLVLIENLDAVENMIQSIRCGQANDIAGKGQFEQAAIRELNLDTWNQFGDDAVPITNEPFNGVAMGQNMF